MSTLRIDALETLRDHAEDDVPHLVPADVVDALEPVEIDDEERERLCGPLRPRERLLDPVVQQRAVRQARQRIAQHGPLSHHEVGEQDARDRRAEDRERGDEDGGGQRAALLGKPHAEKGAKGDHEGSGRRPDEPTARSLPGEGLAHVYSFCDAP